MVGEGESPKGNSNRFAKGYFRVCLRAPVFEDVNVCGIRAGGKGGRSKNLQCRSCFNVGVPSKKSGRGLILRFILAGNSRR
mmetsp:Transcript_20152/g.29912  ORF Transcript_20152/g.29912 Transcript_20152/m.29912 type:complete len:81 (+) Transcript_20152:456-698(+)